MDDVLKDFYKLPNIYKYENVSLQILSEQCAAYEEKVYAIMSRICEKDKQIL